MFELQAQRHLDATCTIAYRLGLYCLLYSQFTTIVAASWADSVVDVMSATVRTKSQCWHFCLVMSTTFRGSGVRLSSFWMCHNSLLFYFVILMFVASRKRLVQPRRTAKRHISYLCISLFIFNFGAEVVLEKCVHFWIATTILVTMHQRKIHDDQFIC